MNIYILNIYNQKKKENYKADYNLKAELINQSRKISKDQIKYQIMQSKNIELVNEGY
jgi:hypothetical protein